MKNILYILILISPMLQAQDSIPYDKADHFSKSDTVLCLYMIDNTGKSETAFFVREMEGDNYWVPEGDGSKATKQANVTRLQYFLKEEEIPQNRIIYDFGILKY